MSAWLTVIFSVSLFAIVVPLLRAQDSEDESQPGQWRIAGQKLDNTWSQPAEHTITPANVNCLSQKWVFTTGGDVSATPTVDADELASVNDSVPSQREANSPWGI
jgi:polyvinyl alcohol dehydrogenase (cytochrome)